MPCLSGFELYSRWVPLLQLQLAPANDTWVGFAIIKYQIACKGI